MSPGPWREPAEAERTQLGAGRWPVPGSWSPPPHPGGPAGCGWGSGRVARSGAGSAAACRTDPEHHQQAELGVAGVEHVVHPDDADGEQRTQTKARPPPPAPTPLRTSGESAGRHGTGPGGIGLAGGGAQLGQPGDGQVRNHEGQLRRPGRSPRRLHRRRVPGQGRHQRTGRRRTGSCHARSPAPGRWPPPGPSSSSTRSGIEASEAGGTPCRPVRPRRPRCRSTTGGSPRGGSTAGTRTASIASIVRRRLQRLVSRAADRQDRRRQSQHQHAADGRGEVGDLRDERHERHRPHPVAQRRDGLAKQQIAERALTGLGPLGWAVAIPKVAMRGWSLIVPQTVPAGAVRITQATADSTGPSAAAQKPWPIPGTRSRRGARGAAVNRAVAAARGRKRSASRRDLRQVSWQIRSTGGSPRSGAPRAGSGSDAPPSPGRGRSG